MKKITMACVGIVLLVAGYYQTRRQAQYIAAKATLSAPTYATSPEPAPTNVKHTFAFRLVKSS